MQKEAAGWDFDQFVTQADALWEKELSPIQIKGTPLQKEIFYTALYHTMIQPNTMSDVNGEYMAADYSTRKVGANEVHYSTFSLWDTYRAAHPLYTLLQPTRSVDFIKSMIRQYDYYGYLPIWQLWGQDNYCMIGNHSIPTVPSGRSSHPLNPPRSVMPPKSINHLFFQVCFISLLFLYTSIWIGFTKCPPTILRFTQLVL